MFDVDNVEFARKTINVRFLSEEANIKWNLQIFPLLKTRLEWLEIFLCDLLHISLKRASFIHCAINNVPRSWQSSMPVRARTCARGHILNEKGSLLGRNNMVWRDLIKSQPCATERVLVVLLSLVFTSDTNPSINTSPTSLITVKTASTQA